MSLNIDEIKKRIIYRSSHRGSKEMDNLISSFVNSIIAFLNNEEIKFLDQFVNLDDEILISVKKKNKLNLKLQINNKIVEKFINYKI